MKIKVAFECAKVTDTRLFKHKKGGSLSSTFHELCQFICDAFGFKEASQFAMMVANQDGQEGGKTIVISTLSDFERVWRLAESHKKKSIKVFVRKQAAQAQAPPQHKEEVKQEGQQAQEESKQAGLEKPSQEAIDAFLNNDVKMDLLADLFQTVFAALVESDFELSIMDCFQAILLSDDGKYSALTQDSCWTYFMQEMLPSYVPKMEAFVVPMLKCQNGQFNPEMLKQWMPTILGFVKKHHQNKQHKRQKFQQFFAQAAAAAAAAGGQKKKEQEQDKQDTNDFKYDDELVSVMRMGFTDVDTIKALLIEHRGDQQHVIQELLLSQN